MESFNDSVDISNCGIIFIFMLKLEFVKYMPDNRYGPMHYSNVMFGYINHHLIHTHGYTYFKILVIILTCCW